MAGIKLFRPDKQTFEFEIAREKPLGQRWPLIRQKFFITDQRNSACVVLLPEAGDRLASCLACANDDEIFHCLVRDEVL